MPLLSKKTFIGIKSESTQGTAVVPSASTDYLLAMDVDIKPNIEILERDYSNTFLDRLAHSIGKKFSTVKFKTELKTTGVANFPETPFIAALQACGLINASGTFSPTSTIQSGMYGPAISATIYVYKDGFLHSMVGSIGTVKFTLEAGKIGFAEFEFSGSYVAVASGTNPVPVFGTAIVPICYSASLTLVGVATEIATKIEIDLGNTIAQRDDVNSANGVLGFMITGRSSKGSVDPEVIDAVILSHNHSDHCGKLPALAKKGFRGQVYCTPASKDLLGVVLKDSVNIQEKEAKHRNKTKNHSAPSQNDIGSLAAQL